MKRIRTFAVRATLVLSLVAGGAFSTPVAASSAASVDITGADNHRPAAKNYRNCTALNRDYRHGVGEPGARDQVRGNTRRVRNFYVSQVLYNANDGKDRDGDGIACEKL